MEDGEKVRELRRLLRDVVALATTPAGWVGRDRKQIAESLADVLLHTLRADAVYVRLQSPVTIEVVRSPRHPGFSDEVQRQWPQSAASSLSVETITTATWPCALRIAMQPIGISGDEGFIAVGCAGLGFPSEAEALLLSLAANQAAVALQSREGEEATGHLAAIVSSSDDAIVSKDLNGIIKSWNKSAEHIFGYTAEEAIGEHITLIIPPERRKEEEDILRRLRNGERIDHFETVRRRKDGTTLDVSLTISPVHDAAGKVIGASKVARNITETKRAQEALRRSEEQFRKLSESLDIEVRARTKELLEQNAEILRQSEQLRELSWRLLRAQDDERRHIARELHDSAGQTLTVLGIGLAQLVQKAGRSNPELVSAAESIQEMVRQLHREIRTTSYLLHPPLLDETGLYSALSWYTEGLVGRSGLHIDLEIPQDLGRLARDLELVVFRLVQECLTNIHRHSGSRTASIRIVREEGRVTIDVRDQGKGMPPEKLAEIQAGRSGVGIRGMRERLRQFNGEMKIESGNHGTRILATIPVPKTAAAEDEPKPESLQTVI
jgi:PAS domain S-box-containing protein